jgi:hypothetical protein
MKKGLILFCLYFLCYVGYAQKDSVKYVRPALKKRASAYDTNAPYFNKWKINMSLGIGINTIGLNLDGQQNYPGLFGILSPDYSQITPPSYSFDANYGITEKSAIGIHLGYTNVLFNPDSASRFNTSGNISVLTAGINYLHCIHSWKHFYYGFEAGIIVLNSHIDTNTFTDKPRGQIAQVQPYAGALIGFRATIGKNWWFNAYLKECVLFNNNNSFPVIDEGLGISYTIDTRKHKHMPVGKDLDTLPRKRDTVKTIPTVKDTNSPYYNKGKLSLSIESGNSDMDVIAQTIYGSVNPGYNQHLFPLLGANVDYGIGRKNDIGGDFVFARVNYSAMSGYSASPSNTSVYIIDARYLHPFGSWRYFYFGFKAGIEYWQPTVDAGVYTPFPGKPSNLQFEAGAILGFHVRVWKQLYLNSEMVISAPVTYFSYGLTYSIYTRKKN